MKIAVEPILPKKKVADYPRRFRGYSHAIKALNDCQETLKERFKV